MSPVNVTEWEIVFQGDVLAASIQDLDAGIEYNFRICALSNLGPSEWNIMAAYHTDSLVAATPQFPFPLVLERLTCNSISVRWNRPADHGSEILYYNVNFQNSQTV